MPHSAGQILTTGQTVMVAAPSDQGKGARVTKTVFVNNPSDTDTVAFAILTYNPANGSTRIIHEGDLETRESVVIDSPIEIFSPEQLRIRVDTMADPPIHYYVMYESVKRSV